MPDASPLKVLAICGSLRKASYNRITLRTLAEIAPSRFTIIERLLDGIPLLNQDDLERFGKPVAVQEFCAQIASADGVIVATPEYLYSIPGVLKNALDWTAGKPSVFEDKPVAIVSAATNAHGGARAQYELRKVMQANRALVMPGPEVFIGGARAKFDADGRLTDETARAGLLDVITAFGAWIDRLRAGVPQLVLKG